MNNLINVRGLVLASSFISRRGLSSLMIQQRTVIPARSTSVAWRGFSAQAEEGEDAVKLTSPKVAKLVEDITLLNLIEVAELVEQLKKTLNLPDSPMMGMPMGMPMAAAPAASGDAEAAGVPAAPEEKAVVNIQLDGFDEGAKIKLIKEVKSISGLGLKEAKALVESAPAAVKSDVKREDAAAIVQALEALGAKVSLV